MKAISTLSPFLKVLDHGLVHIVQEGWYPCYLDVEGRESNTLPEVEVL